MRSAARASPAAYCASWMAALPVVHSKWPRVAAAMVSALEDSQATGSIMEAEVARGEYARKGADMPSWKQAQGGMEPPLPADGHDLYDFRCGWQSFMCSFAETFFREHKVLPSCSKAERALLLSQASGPASAWLHAVPSEEALRFSPLRLQVALRRRLRWRLPLSGGICCRGCRTEMDWLGDRAAACGTSGRIKVRSGPIERTWARSP